MHVALVLVIAAATIAFAVGAVLEKSEHHDEGGSSAANTEPSVNPGDAALGQFVSGESGEEPAAEPTNESTESGGEGGTAHSEPSEPAPGETHAEGSATGEGESAAERASEGSTNEDLLGLDPESTPLVIAAIAGSLFLAFAVWMRPNAALLLVVVCLAMLFFAALDVREALHQSDESNGGLVIVASLVAVLHLSAAGMAGYLARLSLPRPAAT